MIGYVLYSVSTSRAPAKRWIAWTRFCRFLPGQTNRRGLEYYRQSDRDLVFQDSARRYFRLGGLVAGRSAREANWTVTMGGHLPVHKELHAKGGPWTVQRRSGMVAPDGGTKKPRSGSAFSKTPSGMKSFGRPDARLAITEPICGRAFLTHLLNPISVAFSGQPFSPKIGAASRTPSHE
jgi:hypothetical protein